MARFKKGIFIKTHKAKHSNNKTVETSSVVPNNAFDFLSDSVNIKKLPKNPKTANNITDDEFPSKITLASPFKATSNQIILLNIFGRYLFSMIAFVPKKYEATVNSKINMFDIVI
ncbi:MAG: hypothetical protein AUJ41_02685 [Candidatus Pacebacteria bacterium CG1_02_43_31]|nr:MAG: hypothetical protein AUJ41_02685 [Candidatus Pacebacteria bacterium CG1_02_43_31]